MQFPPGRRLSFVLCVALSGCGGGNVDRLLTDLASDDPQARRAAARELGMLKPDSPEVRTALQSSVSDADREVRRLSCFALGEIGGVEGSVLTAALEDSETSVRLAAAYALLKVEPDKDAAKDELSRAMKRGDGGVIVAVTRQGERAKWAVPTLMQLLGDRRPGIRRLAAEGLGKIGPAARDALPVLERAMRDGDDRVREAASQAVELIRIEVSAP